MLTTDEIKAELRKARQAQTDYRLARDKADALRQDLMGGKTVRYNSDGGTHENKENPIENAYCLLADYEAETDERFCEMVRVRKKTESMIMTVPDPVQREILTRRYIIGQKWEDIAESLHYSRRRITQLHGIALKNISLNFPISL